MSDRIRAGTARARYYGGYAYGYPYAYYPYWRRAVIGARLVLGTRTS